MDNKVETVKCKPIKRLDYLADVDEYGNCFGLVPPSEIDIVNKINEIIDYINKKEERL